MTKALRGYYVTNDEEEQYGLAVVAPTVKAAKKIAYESGEILFGDPRWIALRCRWCRAADVSGLDVGVVHNDRDALIRGLYDYLCESPCDECGHDASDVTCHDGRVLCCACIEKESRALILS